MFSVSTAVLLLNLFFEILFNTFFKQKVSERRCCHIFQLLQSLTIYETIINVSLTLYTIIISCKMTFNFNKHTKCLEKYWLDFFSLSFSSRSLNSLLSVCAKIMQLKIYSSLHGNFGGRKVH